jgi:hypothetical protein
MIHASSVLWALVLPFNQGALTLCRSDISWP